MSRSANASSLGFCAGPEATTRRSGEERALSIRRLSPSHAGRRRTLAAPCQRAPGRRDASVPATSRDRSDPGRVQDPAPIGPAEAVRRVRHHDRRGPGRAGRGSRHRAAHGPPRRPGPGGGYYWHEYLTRARGETPTVWPAQLRLTMATDLTPISILPEAKPPGARPVRQALGPSESRQATSSCGDGLVEVRNMHQPTSSNSCGAPPRTFSRGLSSSGEGLNTYRDLLLAGSVLAP
jgi:hypothetical protein